MELEKLKLTWEVYTKEKSEHQILSSSSIEAELNKQTQSLKKRVLRRMSVDAIFMLLVLGAFIAVLYLLNFKAKHIGTLVLLGSGFVLFIHYHTTTLLLNKKYKDSSIRHNVKMMIRTMERYILLYQWVIPIIFGTLVFLGFEFNIFAALGLGIESEFILLPLGISIGFAAFFWLILKAIIYWTFRSETSSLKKLLKDLDSKD